MTVGINNLRPIMTLNKCTLKKSVSIVYELTFLPIPSPLVEKGKVMNVR